MTCQIKQSVTNARRIYPLLLLGAQSDSAISHRVRELGERHLYALSLRGESLRASALVVVVVSVAWHDPQGIFAALKRAVF